MKKRIQNIPVKMWIAGILSVICLLFIGVILICEHQLQKGLYDQQMAKRWAKEGNASQVSVFFATDAVTDESYFKGIEQSVEKALKEASREFSGFSSSEIRESNFAKASSKEIFNSAFSAVELFFDIHMLLSGNNSLYTAVF